MKPNQFKKTIRGLLLPFLLVSGLLAGQASILADQAQYFYDKLGRLVGVMDSQGNAAVYNYDAVGNLLAIQRFTSGATGIGIFVMAPNSARVGTNVTIQGLGFSATPADNVVKFNGTVATVVSATSEGAKTLWKQRLGNQRPCGSGVVWQDGRSWKDVL